MIDFDLDIKPLLDKFKQLEGKERLKAQKTAAGKALKVVKDAIISEIQAEGIPLDQRNKLYPDLTPRGGVQMIVYDDGTGGSVNLMKNYVMIFQNQGTQERSYTTKNGKNHRTGLITPKNFVGKGTQSAGNAAINILNTELEKAINDLWNRR